ncbi:MAG: 6-phosphofructokinase [Acidobacteriota bacterium]|nr:6-phosphofructokinase [Blastocatellia bacterium]MDW8411278.1 6-phosphofructokinase [Acidobacteriota bacterium]
MKRIGILVGGGPAPGTNGVIAAVAIEAINSGCTPIGIHDGFEWLAQRYTDEQHELTIDEVSRIHLDGGVILGTSRRDISSDQQALENALAALRKLRIDALVAIGGDDLVASAVAIEKSSEIKVVQVPKTIDNDMWLPPSVPTLGYETARSLGVRLVDSLMNDARTTRRWYFGVTMGRPTGHLTLGIGKAASAVCSIIPEEFSEPIISLADICDIVEGTIIKRRALGRDYGVILLSEALVERFDPSEVAELQDVDRDAQGNIRVTEIDLGRKVKSEIQRRFEARSIKLTIVDKTIGYELRCAPPVPYDAEYARELGYNAVNYLLRGGSGAMIIVNRGRFEPMGFEKFMDESARRGSKRSVDTASYSYRVARAYMVRIEPEDLSNRPWAEELARAANLDYETFIQRFSVKVGR